MDYITNININNHNNIPQGNQTQQKQQSPVFKHLMSTLQSYQFYNKEILTTQFIYIDQQNKLLQQIKDQIMKRSEIQGSRKLITSFNNIHNNHNTNGENVLEVINMNLQTINLPLTKMQYSCQSVVSNSNSCKVLSQQDALSTSTFTGYKSKFASQYQDSLLQNSLEEVKKLCSIDVYQIIKKACQNYKRFMDFSALQKNLEKARKEIQELTHSNLNLHKEKTNLLWEMNLLKPKVQNLEDQKQRVKKQMDQLSKKQALVSQIQTSFALKQKIQIQNRKKFIKQKQSILSAKSQLENANKQFWGLFDKISQKCQSINCPQQCWKKQAMKKCKDKLFEQRQALKAEQQQLQRQQQLIQNISKQFKAILNNCQKIIQKASQNSIHSMDMSLDMSRSSLDMSFSSKKIF